MGQQRSSNLTQAELTLPSQKLRNEHHPRASQCCRGALLGEQGYEPSRCCSGPYRRLLPRYPIWNDTCHRKRPVSFRRTSVIDLLTISQRLANFCPNFRSELGLRLNWTFVCSQGYHKDHQRRMVQQRWTGYFSADGDEECPSSGRCRRT